jgi:hypothetical protein
VHLRLEVRDSSRPAYWEAPRERGSGSAGRQRNGRPGERRRRPAHVASVVSTLAVPESGPDLHARRDEQSRRDARRARGPPGRGRRAPRERVHGARPGGGVGAPWRSRARRRRRADASPERSTQLALESRPETRVLVAPADRRAAYAFAATRDPIAAGAFGRGSPVRDPRLEDRLDLGRAFAGVAERDRSARPPHAERTRVMHLLRRSRPQGQSATSAGVPPQSNVTISEISLQSGMEIGRARNPVARDGGAHERDG